MGKVSPAILLFIILFSMSYASLCLLAKKPTSLGCMAEERKALLKFKESLSDSSNILLSWNSSDCCIWEGVTCDNITKHVIMLDLHYTEFNTLLVGKILDSSLLNLKHLSYLDLDQNDFQLSPIPSFLGSMKRLQHLDLSYANFAGVVPHSLGNLSSLRVLNLNTTGNLEVDDLMWASNLTSLEHLDLSGIKLNRTKDLVKVFSMLISLVDLVLTQTGIGDTNLSPHECVNSVPHPNIQYLYLDHNSFHGEFPCFLRNMTSLKVLSLSNNEFSGHIPTSLGKLSTLSELHLSNNAFRGAIPSSLGRLPVLEELDLSYNNLSGHFPSSLSNLRALRELFLYHNQLGGEIPVSLGQLANLETIDISFNSFNGTLYEDHFAKLSKLEFFSGSSNMFNFGMGLDWQPPFQLKHLSLQNTKIGGQFPGWLHTQKGLGFLDLSDCGISGTLPKWLEHLNLTELYLSHNQITGPIPRLASSITELNLSDNMLNGSIPNSLCEMKYSDILDLSINQLSGTIPDCWSNLQRLMVFRLSVNELSGVIPDSLGQAHSLAWLHLNNNSLTGQLPSSLKNCSFLMVVDVGDNKLTGKLPAWIGNYLHDLVILRLRNNQFHGVIPRSLCLLSNLHIVDSANNSLTGRIPDCFGNLSGMIKVNTTDVVRYYPPWYDMIYSQVLKGANRKYSRAPTRFVVNLDVSNNNLVGEIPSELTNLSALIGLNLSHNRLEGKIPTKIGSMRSLESIDLSSNRLFGNIPESLSDLSSLSFLNLSNNNLIGKIPTGNQLQTLNDPSIYYGNPGLCGQPLQKNCPTDGLSKSPNVENQGEAGADDGDKVDKIYFYGVVASGFATGFWGLIGALVLKTSWRQAYFHWVEVMIGKVFGL